MIYIIKSGLLVKIGYAKDVQNRLKGLQTGYPVVLELLRSIDGGRAEEVAFHRRFKELRRSGEWFDFHEDMMTFVPPVSSVPVDEPLARALKVAGGSSALARLLGIEPQAVSQWKTIPFRRLLAVEAVTGIPRADLCPVLFGPATFETAA